MPKDTGDLLQGTLGLIILKALAAGELHGYGIARWLEQVTADVLVIEEGSLYPALRRLEDRGLIASRWGTTEHNRTARFYALTRAGRQRLKGDATTWLRFAGAITLVLRAEPSLL